jgi:hypothetical protein
MSWINSRMFAPLSCPFFTRTTAFFFTSGAYLHSAKIHSERVEERPCIPAHYAVAFGWRKLVLGGHFVLSRLMFYDIDWGRGSFELL